MVSDEQRATFAADGVVHVPGAVDAGIVAELVDHADRELRNPGPWVTDTNPGAGRDRLFTSRYRYRDEPVVARAALESGLGRLAADVMGSSSARLYFDHLLVKEPSTAAPTPWHQDLPYWPFLGERIASVWVACGDYTVEESSLEFVRGSHRWGRYFAPVPFDDDAGFTEGGDGDRCPDIDADRSAYDVIGFDVAAGDALVFSALTVHGSPANVGSRRRVAFSTRWLGNDAVWHPHPGADPIVGPGHTRLAPGDAVHDDDCFPLAWSA